MEDINHIKQLYKEKRFKVISERMFEVDSQIVQEVIKKGRKILTCSCENSTTFAHKNICRHKLFFLYLPLLEEWNTRLDKLIEFYTTNRQIEKTDRARQISGFICSDLEELKRWNVKSVRNK